MSSSNQKSPIPRSPIPILPGQNLPNPGLQSSVSFQKDSFGTVDCGLGPVRKPKKGNFENSPTD